MEIMEKTQKRVEKSNGVVPAEKSRKSTKGVIGPLQTKAEKESYKEKKLKWESTKREEGLYRPEMILTLKWPPTPEWSHFFCIDPEMIPN